MDVCVCVRECVCSVRLKVQEETLLIHLATLSMMSLQIGNLNSTCGLLIGQMSKLEDINEYIFADLEEKALRNTIQCSSVL